MFHTRLWLNPEEYRRLISNDVVFLIYHDADTMFDPTLVDELGSVPQIFGVVTKHDAKSYKYVTCSSSN